MRNTIKLTEHRKGNEFAGYKKMIFGKTFYFGANTDRKTAERKAVALMQAAAELQRNGFTEWSAGAIDEALQPFNDVPLHSEGGVSTLPTTELVSSPSTSTTAQQTVTSTIMLHSACDRYLSHLQTQQVSEHTHWWAIDSMQWVKRLIPNRPLKQIGFDELNTIVATFRARPNSRKTGKPISIGTVRTVIGHVRDLFNYLADAGHWDECRRFDRIFKIKADKLTTPAERKKAAAGALSFTLDELASLWRCANTQQRTYMVVMLNTASTQFDLATLTRDMIAAERIERLRNKTNVPGSYWLFPVTRTLLADRMKKTPANDSGLAILTRDGQPVVWYRTTAGRMLRVDSVLQSWFKLLKACDRAAERGECQAVRHLSPKYLRKTGAQMLFDLTAKPSITKLYLSHGSTEEATDGKKSVAETHYYNGRQFSELDAALQRLWVERLANVFKLDA